MEMHEMIADKWYLNHDDESLLCNDSSLKCKIQLTNIAKSKIWQSQSENVFFQLTSLIYVLNLRI